MKNNTQVQKWLVETELDTMACPLCGQQTSVCYFLPQRDISENTVASRCQNCGCYDDPE